MCTGLSAVYHCSWCMTLYCTLLKGDMYSTRMYVCDAEFDRGLHRLNPRIIYDVTDNFSLFMVHGLERRASLELVYHKCIST